ncbi:MAG: hypothetical protein ABIN24_13085, partial [Dyadobacter sp.]
MITYLHSLMAILYLLSFFLFIYSVGYTSKKIAQPSLTEWLITSFILFVGSIIPTGFVLSALDLTANVPAWIAGNFIAIGLHFLLWSKLLPGKPVFSVRAIISN